MGLLHLFPNSVWLLVGKSHGVLFSQHLDLESRHILREDVHSVEHRVFKGESSLVVEIVGLETNGIEAGLVVECGWRRWLPHPSSHHTSCHHP